jgi:hypothetical protein
MEYSLCLEAGIRLAAQEITRFLWNLKVHHHVNGKKKHLNCVTTCYRIFTGPLKCLLSTVTETSRTQRL